MSSNIFTNIGNKRPAEIGILAGVDRKQEGEDLADYLRRKLSEDQSLTLRQIEERSGGRITHSYLSKLLNRIVRNPSVAKLEAIADGLGVRKEEVFAAAGETSLSPPGNIAEHVGVLFYGFDDLSEKDKSETLIAIKLLAEGMQGRRTSKTKRKPSRK